jgi:cytoskeletal protein CcmA (bactofilin family)
MTEFDIKLNQEILNELEKSYSEGKIDSTSYNAMKERYTSRLNELMKQFEGGNVIDEIEVQGARMSSDQVLKFTGVSKIKGGKIEKDIQIYGSSLVEGDLECLSLQVFGMLKCEGNVIAHGDINTSGNFNCDGNLKAEGLVKFASATSIKGNCHIQNDLKTSGTFSCEGDFISDSNIESAGSTKIEGSMNVQGNINSSGSLEIEGNLRIQKNLNGSGKIKVEGNIEVRECIEVNGVVKCEGNMSASSIIIQMPGGLLARKIMRKFEHSKIEGNMSAETVIDIQNIDIEGNVSGNFIKLGPKTKIEGNVSYVENYIADPDVVIEGKTIQKNSTSESIPTKKMNSDENKKESDKIPKYCPYCGGEIGELGELRNYCALCGSKLN